MPCLRLRRDNTVGNMCGIFCSVSTGCEIPEEWKKCKQFISNRGPDFLGESAVDLTETWYGFFAASVLWMQGPTLTRQPAVDDSGNVLLWNGDLFDGPLKSSNDSDTALILHHLEQLSSVISVLRMIRGPFCFVYYQKSTKQLFFGRDRLGRRSLLLKLDKQSRNLVLSSVGAKTVYDFIQLPATGIFQLDLNSHEFSLVCHPWADLSSVDRLELEQKLGLVFGVGESLLQSEEFKPLDNTVEPEEVEVLYLERAVAEVLSERGSEEILGPDNLQNENSRLLLQVLDCLLENKEAKQRVDLLSELLHRSVEVRVRTQPGLCATCLLQRSANQSLDDLEVPKVASKCPHSKVGILFSGGLDSGLLALIADKFVSAEEPIDLVNVAFQRRRSPTSKKTAKRDTGSEEYAGSGYEVPDRITGWQTLEELRRLCPWRRWNFVQVDVSQLELETHRSERISGLLHPLRTVLDESLGCALWFGARAQGLTPMEPVYTSTARVLLLGMGADELFGGYMRHRTILRRSGWTALAKELEMELHRIPERNLARDDRVLSDNGRQGRLPFLDEGVVEFANGLKPWERCYPKEEMPPGLGDKLLLRLVARSLGFEATATFRKRAFQFGSRIADRKENAVDISGRL